MENNQRQKRLTESYARYASDSGGPPVPILTSLKESINIQRAQGEYS